MGNRCGWKIFNNNKMRTESFYSMKYIDSFTINSENFYKIASIMRNYASIQEGISRDYLTLSITKAEELINGDYWSVGCG